MTDNSGTNHATLDFRNVRDLSTVDESKQQYKATVAIPYPTSARAHLRLSEGCMLGDLWGPIKTLDAYPESFVADGSFQRVGFGGKTRQQFYDAMRSLGRSCILSNTLEMVDALGHVVDPAT